MSGLTFGIGLLVLATGRQAGRRLACQMEKMAASDCESPQLGRAS